MLTQYKSHSLDRHLATTWSLSPLLGNYVTPVPAQMRRGPRWFAGSADAIYQSLNLIYDERPDYILVFGADHIYRTDPRQMVAQHLESGAGLTVAGIRDPDRAGRPVRGDRGRQRTGGRSRRSTRSGPTSPAFPTRPTYVLASMGNYVFDAKVLIDVVTRRRAGRGVEPRHRARHHPDAGRRAGRPRLGLRERAPSPACSEREQAYWRDIGTIDAYYDAHMDLISAEPVFNLYNEQLADPQAARAPAGGEVRPPGARAAPGWRSTRWSAPASSSRAAWCGARCSRRASACTRARRSRARCCCTGSTSAATRSSATRSSTRTCGSRPGRRIGVDPEADRERFHISDGRDRRDRQGRDGGCLTCGSRSSRASTRPRSTAAPASTSSTSPASSPGSST